MDTIIEELFKKLPDWFFTIAAIIVLALLVGFAIMVGIAIKRYVDAIGRENRIITLQEEVAELKEESKTQFNSSSQLQNVLMNARTFVNSLNENRKQDEDNNYPLLIQRIVEAMASDIKSHGGERHRCGLWVENQGVLTLYNGSSGFPDHYFSNKQLDINNSIAGRSFRKKQTLKIDNVLEDSDWSPSDTSIPYTSLICIPVGEWGVITIDGRRPMDENAQLIGELYTSIIKGTMEDLLKSFSNHKRERKGDLDE